MKTTFRSMSLADVQQFYDHSEVTREDGQGYCVRSVGKTGNTSKWPNLELHVPVMGLPEQNGKTVNLFRGFWMPEVARSLKLDGFTHFLFGRDAKIRLEPQGKVDQKVCSFTLDDPEDSQFILIITEYPDSQESLFCENIVDYPSQWADISYEIIGEWRVGFRSYHLVPIEFCNTKSEEALSAEELVQRRRHIVHLANAYLGIENPKPVFPNIALLPSPPVSSDTAVAPSSAPSDVVVTSDITHSPDAAPPIPGLEPAVDQSLVRWCYEDDISIAETYVVDFKGRLIAPDNIRDACHKFGEDVKKAGFYTWTQLPENVLILFWNKPSISEPHEFIVHQRPAAISVAQYERVLWIEAKIRSEYKSPLPYQPTPNVGNGWGITDPDRE